MNQHLYTISENIYRNKSNFQNNHWNLYTFVQAKRKWCNSNWVLRLWNI